MFSLSVMIWGIHYKVLQRTQLVRRSDHADVPPVVLVAALSSYRVYAAAGAVAPPLRYVSAPGAVLKAPVQRRDTDVLLEKLRTVWAVRLGMYSLLSMCCVCIKL
jgi:hypothetical protein